MARPRNTRHRSLPGRVGLCNSGNKRPLSGRYGAGASPDSTAVRAKRSPSPRGCCARVHSPGPGSIPAPGDRSLPGGTRRNAGPRRGGRQRGVSREAVTAALAFLPRRCFHAPGRRNAPCQALGATALPVTARVLAGGTVSRGSARSAPSAPFPNHFHAFRSRLAPHSFPTAPSSPTPHARGTLCPRCCSCARGASPRKPTPVRTRWATSYAGGRWAKSRPETQPQPQGAQRRRSSGCARTTSPRHVPAHPAPHTGSTSSPQRPAPAPPYPLLRLPGVHHQQRRLLAIHGQRALVRGLCKTPGEPGWHGTARVAETWSWRRAPLCLAHGFFSPSRGRARSPDTRCLPATSSGPRGG